jgi:4-amino-4-deoxy-L-arabinose transferase-like glycosyltransferase
MKPELLVPFGLAILASILFSFVVYPNIADSLGSSRSADRYDHLAQGILSFGTLSYYPASAPTVLRPPLYPLLLAGCMVTGGEHFILLALLLQAILHGITVMVAARLALVFADRRAALVTGILCALHPMLLWYSGRLVIETLSTLLFTLSVFGAVRYRLQPSFFRAALAGATIGIGLWCKAVYASLLIAVPAALLPRPNGRRAWRDAAVVVCAGMLVITPWLVRNFTLTGRWPLFQALVGYNLFMSDAFVAHAGESPFGYAVLAEKVDYEGMRRGLSAADSLHPVAWQEARLDAVLTQWSIDRYREDPGFFVKKLAFNTVWMWTLGSSTAVSLVLTVVQGGLLLLLVFYLPGVVRREGWHCVMLVPVWVCLVYTAVHLPVYALGRFSLVLVPSLLAVTVAAQRSRYLPPS